MSKKIITEKIYHDKSFQNPFNYKKIKDLNLQDDDIVYHHYEESYFSENESWDAGYILEVVRSREETDEEYNDRIERINSISELNKKNRFEKYLELKKEFENG